VTAHGCHHFQSNVIPRPSSSSSLLALVTPLRANAASLAAASMSLLIALTSQAQASEALGGARGLAFVGFPLHPAGQPGIQRAVHLSEVRLPMLFLQGTRDELADLALLRPIIGALPQATLHVVEDADHSFHVRKKSGRNDSEVLDELARTFAGWAQRTISDSSSRSSRSAGSR